MPPKQVSLKGDVVEQEQETVPKEITFDKYEDIQKTLERINPTEVKDVLYSVVGEDGEAIGSLPAENYKAIVEATSPETVYAIVSKRYKVVNHRDVMEVVIPQMEAIRLNHDRTVVNADGTKMVSIWTQPMERIDGDEISLGLIVRNSIDASMGLGIDMFFFRGVCVNDAVFGYSHVRRAKRLGRTYMRHTKNVSIGDLEERIVEASDNFTLMRAIIETSMKTNIKKEKMKEIVDAMYLPNSMTGELEENMTGNIWKAYNSLTYHITRSRATWFSKLQYYNEAGKLLRLVSV